MFSLRENVIYSGNAGMFRGLRPAIIMGKGEALPQHFAQQNISLSAKWIISHPEGIYHTPQAYITRDLSETNTDLSFRHESAAPHIMIIQILL